MEPSLKPAQSARPAKLTDRFLAYLIDTLPFAAGYSLSLVLLVARWRILPDAPGTWRKFLWAWIGVYVAYHWIGNMAGATIGKWAMGVRVRRRDGARLGAVRSLVRAAGLLASTPALNLGFLWAFVQAESRTWHDLLAGSVVVEARRKSPAESLLNAVVSFILLAGILAGTWWLYVLRPTPSDLEAVAKARAGLRILAQIEEQYRAAHGTYTERLADLAVGSGDVGQFREALRDLYDPRHFRITAGRDHFILSARAKDRRGTVVSLRGPAPGAKIP